eukprot:2035811-Rhodomonas_salina.6
MMTTTMMMDLEATPASRTEKGNGKDSGEGGMRGPFSARARRCRTAGCDAKRLTRLPPPAPLPLRPIQTISMAIRSCPCTLSFTVTSVDSNHRE